MDLDYVFAVFLVKLASPTIILASIIGGFAASRPVHILIAAVVVAFLHQLFLWSYENVHEFSLVSFAVSVPAALITVTIAFVFRRGLEYIMRIND
ncbi:hypothetical protein HW532_06810 [Kaustia mangrovi]|uniref:Uncharacterized protein n=1 Tax=Kaustia mangrovi TaxID=2593653 RepID=A0A7S8C346_9HYPH|nr:hypothetical protein [Kaustia mangrovi]QPC42442.1 hypothetical protein HW532_06810 [Kaustia mangrovi]